jgi:hypothetical protein
MKRVLIVAAVAILAVGCSRRPTDSIDASSILETMIARHATTDTYRAEGTCRRSSDPLPLRVYRWLRYGSGSAVFMIDFSRDGESTFEFVEPHGRRYAARGTESRGVTETPWDTEPAGSWLDALAPLTGVTDGTAIVMARLLLDERLPNDIASITPSGVARAEIVRGIPCHVISGTTPHYEQTLWISQDDSDLVRVVRSVRGRRFSTTTFDFERVSIGKQRAPADEVRSSAP